MKTTPHHSNYDRERVSVNGINIKLLKRLFSYLAPYRAWVILSVFLLASVKAIEAAIPILIGRLTVEVLGPTALSFVPLPWGVGLAALLIMGYAFDAVNVLVRNWVGQRTLFTLRSQTYDAIQRMPISFFDKQSIGRLMSRTIHDVDQINQLYSESAAPILGNLLLLIGIFLGTLYLNWKIAIVLLTIAPFLYWLTQRFQRIQGRCFELLRAIISALNSFIQEHLMGASTIWVFGIRKRETREFERINEDHAAASLESTRNLAIFLAGIQFLHHVVLILIFASLVVFAPIGAEFDAGMFFTFSLYTLMVFRPIADLAERYSVLQAAIAAGGRIFDILDREREQYDKGDALEEIESIVFEDVWFAYTQDHWILRGLSFSMKRGEALAIVGMTGAGKTTLMNLLLRFYDIHKGAITINGRDIRCYSLQQLRRQFSAVMQDPTLFTATLADNITMDNPRVSVATAQRAIEYVDFSSIGHKGSFRSEQSISGSGSGLSMGEAQLITLARAVAHGGSVYILDEATANIDTEGERKIQKAMNRILAEKMAIVIAHRLSTVQHATRILVIHEGCIAETGTHEQLLQRGGIYEKLYRLQFC